ncbi:MAG: glycine--tRNA ligase subunit beta [Armatimonadetes bacterium]|nr:glycine--tRNA ligase subunit beta [Armatimonadota bacterium]
MGDLVLEIGTEELPATWIAPALAQLSEAVADRLRRENLRFQDARTYGTPRRLAVLCGGVIPRQPDTVIEVRGPSAKQSFDAEGNYTSAAFGFARSQDVFPEDLKVKRVAGGEYLFVERPRPGRPTVEVAAAFLPEVIRDLTFPKMMRWDAGGLRFARPIRWLLALYDADVIPFELDGIRSGRTTRGHRYLGLRIGDCRSPNLQSAISNPQSTIEVREAGRYAAVLRSAHVVADPEERRERIRRQVEALARERGAALLEEDLLGEITFGVEHPTAFPGSFDPQFLALPREALILVMRKRQQYFPLADAEGRLLPHFIAVRDGGEEGLDQVRAGNERMLSARFADVRFFCEEDLRTPLPRRVEQLRRLLFQERLGSLYEKAERLAALAGFLCDVWSVEESIRRTVLAAAWLAKADLASGVMKELPELQGTIGREYALRAGEPEAVADAIADHYRPRFPGDALPATEAGRILSVADRADTLVGYFGIGMVPAGSQDPHALRHQAAGLVSILVEAPPLALPDLIEGVYSLYGDRGAGWRSREVVQATLMDFLRLRLENALAERGIRPDTADAILDAGFEDIQFTLSRARALESVRDDPAFARALSAAARVENLLRFAARSELVHVPGEVQIDLLEEDAERELYGAYLDAHPRVADAVRRVDPGAVLRHLGELAPAVEEFLDTVLVMSDDEVLRTNRLRLLTEVNALFLRIGDLGRLAADAA